MLTLEVKLTPGADLARVESLVEATCRSRGLSTSMKTSLRSFPGSVHWHLKKGAERGTVEVTFWRKGMRLWVSVHENRAGAWTDSEARELKAAFERGVLRDK